MTSPKPDRRRSDPLRDAYARMAADGVREAEALEWCEALIADVADPSEERCADPTPLVPPTSAAGAGE